MQGAVAERRLLCAADCHALVYAASGLDTCAGYRSGSGFGFGFGFHSAASFCASAICAGVILAAICSRPSRRMKQEGAEASAVR